LTEQRLIGWLSLAMIPVTVLMWLAGFVSPVHAVVVGTLLAGSAIAMLRADRSAGQQASNWTSDRRRWLSYGLLLVALAALPTARTEGWPLAGVIGGCAVAGLIVTAALEARDKRR
jgi:hypothetical protein